MKSELARIRAALLDPATTSEQYDRLYVAQQALMWATEPDAFRRPFDTAMGTQEGLEGCSAPAHQPGS